MRTRTKKKLMGTALLAGIVIGATNLGAYLADKSIKTTQRTPDYEVVRIEYDMPEFTIPTGDTSFKTYMDYRCITCKNSPQYRLQGDCWTDENGLRRCGDDYVIAVGSYYANCIGDRLEITLESGTEFTAIVGDFKADAHTDSTNRYTPMNYGGKNVVEFIVDARELDSTAKEMGDISYIDGFDGDIKRIESCGDIEQVMV